MKNSKKSLMKTKTIHNSFFRVTSWLMTMRQPSHIIFLNAIKWVTENTVKQFHSYLLLFVQVFTILSLSQNLIGDEGVESIAQALQKNRVSQHHFLRLFHFYLFFSYRHSSTSTYLKIGSQTKAHNLLLKHYSKTQSDNITLFTSSIFIFCCSYRHLKELTSQKMKSDIKVHNRLVEHYFTTQSGNLMFFL